MVRVALDQSTVAVFARRVTVAPGYDLATHPR
jgi:hypothetical protein